YRKNEENGLNSEVRNDLSSNAADLRDPLKYKLVRKLHESIFEKEGFLSKSASAFGRRSAKGKFCRNVEKALRAGILHCRDCGDCALPFTDFICPMTQCPKEQRNGPCGGSRNGYCELYPNKRPCIYVTAYDRLKARNKTDLLRVKVDPPSCSLYGTSELHNFFTGKDTYSKWKERNRD
ncbi:MAG: methylenetetrahydrofolate reductase C-terminal domain-containing protein, partial [Clostridia bacterium]